jgi:plasmid stabilization system protein ParE
MTSYILVSEPNADWDVEAVFTWYEKEKTGLGWEFLDELQAAFDRIAEDPFKYRVIRREIRRSLTHRFPYAIYFSVESNVVVVLAVLHTRRNPAVWKRRTI